MLTLPFRDKGCSFSFKALPLTCMTFVSFSVRVLNYSGTTVIRSDSQYGGGEPASPKIEILYNYFTSLHQNLILVKHRIVCYSTCLFRW
jgi:hypothetical protein